MEHRLGRIASERSQKGGIGSPLIAIYRKGYSLHQGRNSGGTWTGTPQYTFILSTCRKSATILHMVLFSKEQRLFILFGLFISFLIAMNVLGGKIISFGPFSASVAFFIVPWSFMVTDIIEEVYGKKKAQEMIIAGVIALIVFLGFILLFVALPPASRFKQNEEYNAIFGTSARIVFASIVAFLLSQFNDMWSFWRLREVTNKRFLWFRSNISTILSMIIDTFVFMFLAFYMLTPQFTAWFVIQLIIPYLIFKMIWGVVSTPLVYAGASWLRAGGKIKD